MHSGCIFIFILQHDAVRLTSAPLSTHWTTPCTQWAWSTAQSHFCVFTSRWIFMTDFWNTVKLPHMRPPAWTADKHSPVRHCFFWPPSGAALLHHPWSLFQQESAIYVALTLPLSASDSDRTHGLWVLGHPCSSRWWLFQTSLIGWQAEWSKALRVPVPKPFQPQP